MNAKVSDPRIIIELNSLKSIVPFGIKYNNSFNEVKDISIDGNTLVYINNNNEIQSVSSYIREIKRLQSARWINHLYFIDGYGKEQKFKDFVRQKYNLIFT